MDYDTPRDLVNELQKEIWIKKVIVNRANGRMRSWVTTVHPDQLQCEIDGPCIHGSYNLCQTFIFSDGTIRLLPFPIAGKIYEKYADEKVAMEVEVLMLVRERTSIPVPKVYSWGLAADNPLGLGPFIPMDFIEGIHVSTLLRDSDSDSILIREDISDRDIEYLYRQISWFQLQLFHLNFDRIGNLPTLKRGFSAPVRPLTWKVHDVIQLGGVNTFGICHPLCDRY